MHTLVNQDKKSVSRHLDSKKTAASIALAEWEMSHIHCTKQHASNSTADVGHSSFSVNYGVKTRPDCRAVTTRRYLWTGSWKRRALDVGANAAAEKNGVGRTQVKESNAPAAAVARPATASIFNPFCAAPFNSAANRRGRGKGEAERGRGEAGREGDSRSGRGSAVPCRDSRV